MNIQRECWLCSDCTIAECNGDYSGMAKSRAAAVGAAFDEWSKRHPGESFAPNWDSETGKGIDPFSSRQCDVCCTRLSGERHRWAILSQPTKPKEQV